MEIRLVLIKAGMIMMSTPDSEIEHFMKKILASAGKLLDDLSLVCKSPMKPMQKISVFCTFCKLSMMYLFSSWFHFKKVKIHHCSFCDCDYRTLFLLYKEIFLRLDYCFISPKPKPVIIDCGANVGMSILLFKFIYPDSVIHAFEPDPHAYKRLQKFVSCNHLSSVYLYNLALSNQDGMIDFYTNRDEHGLCMSSIAREGLHDKILAPCKRLSGYIQAPVDFLKMDIEGAEGFVIEDLCSTKKLGMINEILMEYHHRIESKSSELSRLLACFEEEGWNYNIRTKVFNFWNQETFQDIIIRFYK